MQSNKIKFFVPIMMCVSLALLGCSDDKKIEVEKKVSEIHNAYNSHDYDLIYQEFAKRIKLKTTKEQTFSLFEKEMSEAGEYKNSELVDYKETTYINNNADVITLTYRSAFSKSYVEEIFYFIYEEEQPKLSGYRYIIVEK
ncbi:hypothetical protein [Citrobacter farmeri]